MMIKMNKMNKAVMMDDKDLLFSQMMATYWNFCWEEKTRDLSIPKYPLRGRKIELADFLEEGEDGVEEVVVSILQEYSANLA